MSEPLYIHCPDCDVIRTAEPGKVSECPACGHSFRLGDGSIVRPATAEAVAASQKPPSTEDAARIAAMKAVIDSVSTHEPAPAPAAKEETHGWGSVITGFVIGAAAIPIGQLLLPVHEVIGVLAGILLGFSGVSAFFLGLRDVTGWKTVGVSVATFVAANLAITIGLVGAEALATG